ncbi:MULTISPECIES: DUF4105 domain-containing protein [unclassified Pseudoalteromonas]|uniref:Lnb N-terminal periplasmic domain-containing protein n=1 Tax=unclassified Pseudoalteromonas TaxID=194690 RepID=UPI00201E5BAF|nr:MULTISPECIES: DUF4105 domain-containing protein [unclassified Pseudoalteromonas]
MGFYSIMRGILLSSCLLFSCLAYSTTPTLEIAHHPYWLKLGHYNQPFFSMYESEVDSSEFFFSEVGKTDPHAELLATIAAFKSDDDNQAKCRFPARYNWLKEHFFTNWPALSCPEIETWQQLINPKGMTLVFPTAFMNDPSSMFGHTLLRIDAKDQTRSRELIAFAVNFAAEPDVTDNAALYALKGIIGQYPGKFTLMPYYRKVREYNDLESRDIWEYKLSLSDQEIQRVLLHLWEMQWATFDYFFVDENCSYQLLALLQLARDNLSLTAPFSSHAIPSDTVAALKQHGLLQPPRYRAASGTKLINYESQLTEQQVYLARLLRDGVALDELSLAPEQAVPVLEMAYEWLNYQYYDQGLARDAIAPRLTKLLHQRSQFHVVSPFKPAPKPRVSPDNGHGSSRVGVIFNDYEHTASRFGLTYRVAYHDLLDNPGGFIPGAQISFFDLEVNQDSNENLHLERLLLIDAMSLAPDNGLFNSWSWNVRAGFDRQPTQTKREGRLFLQGGYGKSFGDASHLQSYLLGSSVVQSGDLIDSVSFGLGSEAGVIWQVTDSQKLALSGQAFWLMNEPSVDYQLTFSAHWQIALAQNWGLRSSAIYQDWQRSEQQFKLQLFHYF